MNGNKCQIVQIFFRMKFNIRKMNNLLVGVNILKNNEKSRRQIINA